MLRLVVVAMVAFALGVALLPTPPTDAAGACANESAFCPAPRAT
ncbi:MAG: hypothetical protein U1E56_05240 [Bauldia sp.]